jgi:hypothetical protein
LHIDSPRPVPLEFIFLSSLVKSVNNFGKSSSFMPTPVSLISILKVMNFYCFESSIDDV